MYVVVSPQSYVALRVQVTLSLADIQLKTTPAKPANIRMRGSLAFSLLYKHPRDRLPGSVSESLLWPAGNSQESFSRLNRKLPQWTVQKS